MQNIAGQWFKSYLHDSRQQVEIKSPDSNNSTYSNWDIIKHGVPQGLILGPLLSLIYINGLPPTINSLSKPVLFDDTNIEPHVGICLKNLIFFHKPANFCSHYYHL
jgi:hypothetical protein